jgi:hypothetical protein
VRRTPMRRSSQGACRRQTGTVRLHIEFFEPVESLRTNPSAPSVHLHIGKKPLFARFPVQTARRRVQTTSGGLAPFIRSRLEASSLGAVGADILEPTASTVSRTGGEEYGSGASEFVRRVPDARGASLTGSTSRTREASTASRSALPRGEDCEPTVRRAEGHEGGRVPDSARRSSFDTVQGAASLEGIGQEGRATSRAGGSSAKQIENAKGFLRRRARGSGAALVAGSRLAKAVFFAGVVICE